jgi:hypothetical protein
MLRKLFDTLRAKRASDNPSEVVSESTYGGLIIQVAPLKDDNGWRVGGAILSSDDPATAQRLAFVRADVFSSRETAAEMTLAKAQRLIDEQGERLFTKTA